MMKKAFTLIELLIVVVVIVTLMTIVFKLAGVGDDATSRNKTINRMQRLENCLSGYYAAYGSYPPVKLHGSRDYRLEVDNHGMQGTGEASGGSIDKIWKSVEAACRSQPVAMSFPFHESKKDYVDAFSQLQVDNHNGDMSYKYEALYDNTILNGQEQMTHSDWSSVQLYKFGMLSYLLPRFLVIMGGDFDQDRKKPLKHELFENYSQWTENNEKPMNFDNGMPYATWKEVNERVNNEPWKIAAIPSQAVCARWLPNLEGIVHSTSDRTIYGVRLHDASRRELSQEIHSPGGYKGEKNTSRQYLLDSLTVRDGYWNKDRSTWGVEFYYYSPPPHQNYRLWSSGKNCRTFPPWVTNEELNTLSGADRKTVQEWISDDIVHMSN